MVLNTLMLTRVHIVLIIEKHQRNTKSLKLLNNIKFGYTAATTVLNEIKQHTQNAQR